MCVSEMTSLGGKRRVYSSQPSASCGVYYVRCCLAGWCLTSLPLHNLFMAKYTSQADGEKINDKRKVVC
jgi:hypothetical protein